MKPIQGNGRLSTLLGGCAKEMILDVNLLPFLHLMLLTYEHICGKIEAFQRGTLDAFRSRRNSVDIQYVNGISITLGSPHKHVWTFASGVSDHVRYTSRNCPCATHPGPSAPAFEGN